MAMPVMVPRYTVADLDSFPNDGNRYELLDGVLLVSPAPMPPHEFVVIRIRDQLIGYLDRAALVLTNGAVQVGATNYLEPDLLVLPASTPVARDWGKIRGFWLAVEVSGRGSRIYDRDFKQAAYLALGVAEAWRVDLGEHSIDVGRPGSAGLITVRDRLVWRPPGFEVEFSLDIPALFTGIEDDG
jgi:Uma2 family endonuclease